MEEEKEMSRHGDIITPTAATLVEEQKKNKVVRYKECLKNHAAALGGNATDGCGEFMPSSAEQGSLEALKCLACNCHRNFHKKEIDSESLILIFSNHHHHHHLPSMNQQMIVSHVPSESDENKDGGNGVRAVEKAKKRFRTRFSQEQKQKMLYFAEKVGWKMQKLDDSFLQRFCQEIGIKRRVLKVWMHNNKHHFARGSEIKN
ncbi:zinc-finger homeodomain protein 4-like [Euphorbia lathyris]|uniref:zinc-finger homeodomain protein 4-like n=1 Tax=Euphorbia lathyris TaxID=212925 RepID=UPI003313F9B7